MTNPEMKEEEAIHFVVEGDPVPQPRARVSFRGHAYYPKRREVMDYPTYRDLVRAEARAQLQPWDGYPSGSLAFSLRVFVYLRQRALGDVDKFLGTVMDGLEGAAYRNDRQVAEAYVKHHYGARNPRLEVWIQAMKD